MSTSAKIIVAVISYFFLLIVLLTLLYFIVEKPLINKLREESKSSIRITIRNKIRRARLLQYVAATTYLFAGVIFAFHYSIAAGITALTFMFMEIVIAYKDLSINISTIGYDDFIKKYENKSFGLYLRGFATDNYLPYRLINQPFKDKFCELALYNILKTYSKLDLISVGMTKEIDAPMGALRVYLDDDKWKKCVEEMIDNAQCIYILIDDSESCIWEIIKSIHCLDKTIFIIDDIDKYNNVRKQINTFINFPELIIPANSIGIVKTIDNKIESEIITNCTSDYQYMLY